MHFSYLVIHSSWVVVHIKHAYLFLSAHTFPAVISTRIHISFFTRFPHKFALYGMLSGSVLAVESKDTGSVQALIVWLSAALFSWSHRACLYICCCCSVSQEWPTLCNLMDYSTPGFPVRHNPPEFSQTHVHWVSDAIQPSCPLWSPSLPAFNLSQHQGFFQWVSSSHQVAKVLELQLHTSVLPMNIQGWFPLGLTVLVSLLSKGLLRDFLSTTVQGISFSVLSLPYGPHPYTTTWKNHSFYFCQQTFVGKVISLHFNMLSRFVTAFFPRSKCLLILWLQSPSAVILEHKKVTSVTLSIVSPPICHEVMGPDAMIFVFWMLSFKPVFSLSSFTFIKDFFNSSLLSAIRVVIIWGYWYFSQQSWFQLVLHPTHHYMMYSAYKLNEGEGNIQPWLTPFPICD